MDKRQLVSAAKERGVAVSEKQIDRWRENRLLPAAPPIGRGRGKGVGRQAPPQTLEQLTALSTLLQEDRSLDRAALRLWLGGYDVPLSRVRAALKTLVPLEVPSEEFIASKTPELIERIRRRKSASKRARSLAKDEQLDVVFETFTKLLHNKPVSPGAALDLERLTGVDRGRIEAPEGAEPWLRSDPSETLQPLLELKGDWLRCVHDATDGQLEKARADFNNFEKLKRWAVLLQSIHGENPFGFGSIASPTLGGTRAEEIPIMFVVLFYVVREHPEWSETLETLAMTSESAWKQIRGLMHERGVSVDQLRDLMSRQPSTTRNA